MPPRQERFFERIGHDDSHGKKAYEERGLLGSWQRASHVRLLAGSLFKEEIVLCPCGWWWCRHPPKEEQSWKRIEAAWDVLVGEGLDPWDSSWVAPRSEALPASIRASANFLVNGPPGKPILPATDEEIQQRIAEFRWVDRDLPPEAVQAPRDLSAQARKCAAWAAELYFEAQCWHRMGWGAQGESGLRTWQATMRKLANVLNAMRDSPVFSHCEDIAKQHLKEDFRLPATFDDCHQADHLTIGESCWAIANCSDALRMLNEERQGKRQGRGRPANRGFERLVDWATQRDVSAGRLARLLAAAKVHDPPGSKSVPDESTWLERIKSKKRRGRATGQPK